jgi:hypothetical protein
MARQAARQEKTAINQAIYPYYRLLPVIRSERISGETFFIHQTGLGQFIPSETHGGNF